MKLLYIHQHFVTPRGAGAIRSYQMAREMIARGHTVTMLCGRMAGGDTGLSGPFERGRRRGIVDGIDVIEIDLAYSNRDGFLRRVRAFMLFMFRAAMVTLREDYDVLFATTTPLTVGVPAMAGRWLRGKPFVFEVRDLWPELPRAMKVIRNPLILWAMSVLELASYRSARRLIGLSPGIVDGIVRRGVDRERIALIPNGCDLEIFDIAAEGAAPAGVREDQLLAVFTGTHGIANGLDAVIDAAGELRRRGREDIAIALVGDGMRKADLVARANHEILTNVHFLTPMRKPDLALLMARADVGMQILANVPAFYFGTSPNKFFDYIAAGKPVLINYPGWLAGLVAQEDCGRAVPPDDPVAFAYALIAFADDRVATRQQGENARALARRDFDRALLAKRWSDWVEGAMVHCRRTENA